MSTADIEFAGVDKIELGSACEYLDLPRKRLNKWIEAGVFNDTPYLSALNACDSKETLIPLSSLACMGMMWDFVRNIGENYADMEILWLNMVESFIDVLLLGDVPKCVIVSNTDIEVIITDEFEYPLLDGEVPAVLFFNEHLLRIGGWI